MMNGKKKRFFLHSILGALLLIGFLKAVFGLESGQGEKNREQLETAIRRAAVTCYAVEGAYPEDLAYMQKYYGIQYDEKRYTVMYDVFASNLMPDITVLEKER